MNIKQKLDSSVPVILDKLGYFFNPLILKFANEKDQLLIFYFHGIYDSLQQKRKHHIDPQNNITKEQLSEFVEYFLLSNYQFIAPKDLQKDLSEGKSYVMITFDDGYYNNYYSLPVLEEFQVPATYFITTKNLISNDSYWWDVVYKYRTQKAVSPKIIRDEQDYLKRFKYDEINQYLLKNFGKDCFVPWSNIDRPMTIEELRVFGKHDLVNIGNHTHNHSILTNYSLKEAAVEFEKSNNILKQVLGYSPNSMAFPNGNYSSSLIKVANDAGFKYVFTTDNCINQLPLKNTDIVTLNRFMARTIPICNYGSFSRLGYDGNKLYNNLKKKIINFID